MSIVACGVVACRLVELRRYRNIWMWLRSGRAALRKFVKQERLTQIEAAKRLKVTQPRVSDLMRRKISRFSLDTLVTMSSDAGLGVNLRITARPCLAKLATQVGTTVRSSLVSCYQLRLVRIDSLPSAFSARMYARRPSMSFGSRLKSGLTARVLEITNVPHVGHVI